MLWKKQDLSGDRTCNRIGNRLKWGYRMSLFGVTADSIDTNKSALTAHVMVGVRWKHRRITIHTVQKNQEQHNVFEKHFNIVTIITL